MAVDSCQCLFFALTDNKINLMRKNNIAASSILFAACGLQHTALTVDISVIIYLSCRHTLAALADFTENSVIHRLLLFVFTSA
jgi:hypothetical protein